jgi:hypothetical protein
MPPAYKSKAKAQKSQSPWSHLSLFANESQRMLKWFAPTRSFPSALFFMPSSLSLLLIHDRLSLSPPAAILSSMPKLLQQRFVAFFFYKEKTCFFEHQFVSSSDGKFFPMVARSSPLPLTPSTTSSASKPLPPHHPPRWTTSSRTKAQLPSSSYPKDGLSPIHSCANRPGRHS